MTFIVNNINKSIHLPDVSPKHKGQATVMMHQRKTPSGKVALVKQHTKLVDKVDKKITIDKEKVVKEVDKYNKFIDKYKKDTSKVTISKNDMGQYFTYDNLSNSFILDKDSVYDSKWDINNKEPLKSTYEGRPIKKFLISHKTKKLVLAKPVGTESHAQALGIGKNAGDAGIDTFDDYVRGFYDYKENAVGLRTPYVKGLKENNWIWDDTTRSEAFDIQYKIADYLFRNDPELKVVINIGNKDVGATEEFRINSIYDPDKVRTITSK
jgi:transcription elongation factor Elf1